MDLEVAFVGALVQVKTWRVLGRVLELLDARNQVVARFEAPGQGSTPIVGAPDRFINKVWKIDSSVAPVTLYVFLSEGTLLVTSATGKPAVGTWKYQDRFVIRSHNPRGSVEIALIPAAPARPK